MSAASGPEVALITGSGGKVYYALYVLAKEWLGTGGRVITSFRREFVEEFCPSISWRLVYLQEPSDLMQFWNLDNGKDLFLFDLTIMDEGAAFFKRQEPVNEAHTQQCIKAMAKTSMVAFVAEQKSDLNALWGGLVSLELDCKIKGDGYVSVYSKAELIDQRSLKAFGK